MPNKDEKDAVGLDEAQLGAIVEHLQTQEEASLASTLESLESFEIWAKGHPALRQMTIVQSISEIGPAILRALRILLGLERGDREAPAKANRGD